MTAPAVGLRERLLAAAEKAMDSGYETADSALLREAADALPESFNINGARDGVVTLSEIPKGTVTVSFDPRDNRLTVLDAGKLFACVQPFLVAAALPDGWVLVPRASTQAMEAAALAWMAGFQHMRKQDRLNAMANAYVAMLAAAPTPGDAR